MVPTCTPGATAKDRVDATVNAIRLSWETTEGEGAGEGADTEVDPIYPPTFFS